jgi:hypothetical protein
MYSHAEFWLENMKKIKIIYKEFSPCLTGNTLRLRYRAQLVNAV